MRSKVNKGFSMVEIIISVAIFAMLMIPIVNGIISSINNTTKAKTLQYRNEYATNAMEYVKEDSIANILAGDYYTSTGATDVSSSAAFYIPTGDSLDSDLKKVKSILTTKGVSCSEETSVVDNGEVGDDQEFYPYEEYSSLGKVELGPKHTPYVYKVQITNKVYAEKQAEGTFVNPNNIKMGIVEDIDYQKIALFNGTIANYDKSVSEAFMSRKIEKEMERDQSWRDIITGQNSDEAVPLFSNDTVTRRILIKVEKQTDKYVVSCSLIYTDSNSLLGAADNTIQYKPFEYEYPLDKPIPNIYLMYNVCLYNGAYSDNDYIVFDTSGIGADDPPINCFIVETAEKHSATLVDTDGVLSNTILYNNNITSSGDDDSRSNVRIHVIATKDAYVDNMYVYMNFDGIGGVSSSGDDNVKNSDVLYKPTELNGAEALYGTLNASDYKPLIEGNIGSLNSANQESRGLYRVMIWMQEGDDPDVLKNVVGDDPSAANYLQPTMMATKGGNES